VVGCAELRGVCCGILLVLRAVMEKVTNNGAGSAAAAVASTETGLFTRF
jgi:hypothetical protein